MPLTRKIALDATPEEVWDKVSTGPGLSSWFVPHELEPRKGGYGRADFGGGTYTEGRVLEFEPGRRIALGAERIAPDVGAEPEPETGTRLEFWVGDGDEDPEGFPGGDYRGIGDVRGRSRKPGTPRAVLYLHQEGFPDVDQEVYEDGWDVYLHTLTEYFKHFRGKTAVCTTTLVRAPRDPQDAFQTAVSGLGVGDASEGAEVSCNPLGREQIEGVVDLRVSGRLEALGLRDDRGFIRVTAAPLADDAAGVTLHRYEYVADPPVELASVRDADDWQGWLERQYA
ncbi:MAG TPA: SRPBCC domain-containing protein [Solirubrobacteraceae bacterium]|jgi:uncharacterized protein YndB with AHSA1/START domain|nr:SRPBCC domain-containing protein [Solirubrobacteraceae bacterium]